MVVVVRPGDGGSTTSLVARTRSPSLRVQVGFGRGVLVTCSVRVGLAIAEFFSVNFLFCSVVCNLCWMNLASARRKDYPPGGGGQFNLSILHVFACYVVGDGFAHLRDRTRPPRVFLKHGANARHKQKNEPSGNHVVCSGFELLLCVLVDCCCLLCFPCSCSIYICAPYLVESLPFRVNWHGVVATVESAVRCIVFSQLESSFSTE